MGNRGADAPTGTSEPIICLHHSIQASTASIRTSDGHPIGALGVCSAPDSAENLIDAIYILSIVTLHALTDPNSQRQCKYEEVFCIGRVEDTMVLTSERRQCIH